MREPWPAARGAEQKPSAEPKGGPARALWVCVRARLSGQIDEPGSRGHRRLYGLQGLAVAGPGLLVMLADTDAGNVVTAAQAGAQWGYRLLPLVLLLAPMLYLIQELTVRLAIHTGKGHGELIRERLGGRWACLAGASLAAATLGCLVTQLTAVAGIGELFGVSRWLALPLAGIALLAVATWGAYRRIERMAIFIGLFELAFFAVACFAHPSITILSSEIGDLPFGDRTFMYMAAAIIGAVFSPWMVFYQQFAIADRKLRPQHIGAARLDTIVGATLTQCLTGAVLISAAAAIGKGRGLVSLSSVGDISRVLSPVLGDSAGRVVFSIGVLGASLVAAIVASLAFAWGIGELAGFRQSFESRPLEASWFYGVYGIAVVGAGFGVGLSSDLLRLNMAAQILNAFLLPVVLGLLITLALKELPSGLRPSGWRLRLILAGSGLSCALGLFGGIRWLT